MKRQIEIFTAGCPVCEPTVKTVKEMACDSCEVTIYNLSKQDNTAVASAKVKEYHVTTLPAVAVNGKLLSCCQDRGISKEELAAAGVGKA